MSGPHINNGKSPSNSKKFICAVCGKDFFISESVLARYKDWAPKQCMKCRKRVAPGQTKVSAELSPEETLKQFHKGPDAGIFTDGHCVPNPGRGGWGAAKVIAGELIEERCGQEASTTNNRMELKALIEGFKMLGQDEETVVYSDSELCVNTITKWASGWKQKGWKKKGGEIKNLDLVKELYELAQSRPNARLEWIRGHSGARWNEYADALSRTPSPEGVT